mmetsp:Transcript_2967/g.12027  ORF Transcript_2967/g.12027 Transcript_2967/m.12027 type:complete len:394 (-) Transcript_2967:97-1278(-)
MSSDEDSKTLYPAPMFAPASNSLLPTITPADLHDLFSPEFAAYTPTAKELTAPDGSLAVLPTFDDPNGVDVDTFDPLLTTLEPVSTVKVEEENGKKLASARLRAQAEAEKMLRKQPSRVKRKRQGFREDDSNSADFGQADALVPEDHKMERRLRNREHAKRSRLRKRFLLESLQSQLTELRDENKALREVVRTRFPDRAQGILDECTQTQSDLLEDLNGEGTTKARPRVALPSDNDVSPKDSGELSRQLVEQDYRLIRALQHSQQCFAISDPGLADNPIVYASQGFLDLTGYTMRQVLGRNCRFLQGPGTDQDAVQAIRDGICEGRDVSVCLLNYKADGTPFWNQFFIAPLCAADGSIVNFVGVQCEVQSNKAEDMQIRVKRIKNIEVYVDES